MQKKIKLRPGIQEVIYLAKKNQLKLGLATASSFTSVNALSTAIWKKPINEIFDFLVFGSEVQNKKPAPDIYKKILGKLTLPANKAIAIEDSRIGLLAAKTAGLYTIVTPSSYTAQENFFEADEVCMSLVQSSLMSSLKKANC